MKPTTIETRWARQVAPNNSLPEYPRPQMVREDSWQNMNGIWQYTITSLVNDMPINFQGNILVPFPLESALSGVKKSLKPNEYLWYKRSFNVNIEKNKRLLLHFGAVDWQATVYVNGKEVGSHTGGYTEFSFDITSFLVNGDNQLVLRVFDPTDQGIGPHGKQVLNPGNIYYTPSSGIWQTVWLETVPTDYIESIRITTDIDKSVVSLLIKISSTIVDKSTLSINVPGCNTCEVLKKVQDKDHINAMLKIPNARLWSPDDPYLYDLEVAINKDKVKSYFGMRKIDIQKDSKGVDRIYLNNKYTYNLGTLDQGYWPDGLYTAPTDSALQFDISVIKKMGFNTIRKHIKVEPARWYYHTDRLGILVWQDMVNPNQGLPEGSKSEFERESAEIMQQLFNHPSIVTWVLFNEKWGYYDQGRLTKWMKAKDPTRLINGHSGEMLYVNNQLRSPSPDAWIGSDLTDVHAYPMPGNIQTRPGMATAIGEFGGIGVPIEGHLWDDLTTGWGYDGINTPGTLILKYSEIIDSLKKMEAEGLSASIYTQPFDVETEQNGLITYDRKVIKIPINKIRDLNIELYRSKAFKFEPYQLLDALSLEKGQGTYIAGLKKYESGARDSLLLRSLVTMADSRLDSAKTQRFLKEYLRILFAPLSESNLRFIKRYTYTTRDTGFTIIFKNIDRANKFWGNNRAENFLKNIIGKQEIQPQLDNDIVAPDWEKLVRKLSNDFGVLGSEKAAGMAMLYYHGKGDWQKFGQYYALYYKTAIGRSEYHINNLSWTVFEKIDDPLILAIAVKASKYSVEHFGPKDANEIDTYANLLYKVGDKKLAIEWQKKAMDLSKDSRPIRVNYQKMIDGVPTWK
ncbi:glycoside hydrolase family 2 protein [Chitinophaga sp. S165]|uniref:glycoside hydrolase family 2 protein n=1 Tax=Chitinophaga sp. S165 TaxID=2135462 RepID=UPI001E583AF6|nr:sugar-binding domain-containing protein [Chitinophaga sp. S165]